MGKWPLITALQVGGEDLYVDQFCYDTCPSLTLGHIFRFEASSVSENQREVIIDVMGVTGPAVLRIQRKSNLSGGNWIDVETTTTNVPGGSAGEFRCAGIVPLEDRAFYRVCANYQ